MQVGTTRSMRFALAVAAVVFAVAGCAEESSVGSGVEVGGGSGQGALRDQGSTTVPKDGQATDTTAPRGQSEGAETQAGIGGETEDTVATPQDTTPDTEAPETPQTTAPKPETEIEITDGGTSFDPIIAAAVTGGKVTWINTGTSDRQVADQGGQYFASPMISPGSSWTWTVTAPAGTVVTYRDTTRPYAQGAKIEVS